MKDSIFWADIPEGKENAVSYATLCARWGKNERDVRAILHDLSREDNGDNFVLIRSSKNGGGFYKTDDRAEMQAYRQECLNKGRSNFAPVKKINRILRDDLEALQASLFNNLKAVRLEKGMKQTEVVEALRGRGCEIDVSLLSKFENGVCLPTLIQLVHLSDIYGVPADELMSVEESYQIYI